MRRNERYEARLINDCRSRWTGSVVCIEALRDPAGKVTGALIVISHPERPKPERKEDIKP